MSPTEWAALFLWLALSYSAMIPGAFLGLDRESWWSWYKGLRKAPWNPPAWLFGPVWTILYGMIGTAVFFAWKTREDSVLYNTSLILFFVQYLMNAAWTPAFFGFRALRTALWLLIGTLVANVVTTVLFFFLSVLAGGLMCPYLGWLCYAASLNVYIILQNK